MANLILSIIAIALSALSINFLESGFEKHQTANSYQKFFHKAQSITLGLKSYISENGYFPTKEDLVSNKYIYNYEQFKVNEESEWQLDSFYEVAYLSIPSTRYHDSGINMDLCLEINQNNSGLKCVSMEDDYADALSFGSIDISDLEKSENFLVYYKI